MAESWKGQEEQPGAGSQKDPSRFLQLAQHWSALGPVLQIEELLAGRTVDKIEHADELKRHKRYSDDRFQDPALEKGYRSLEFGTWLFVLALHSVHSIKEIFALCVDADAQCLSFAP